MQTQQQIIANRPKFEVKKFGGTVMWNWEVPVENCAICKQLIMGKCIDCSSQVVNLNENQCQIVWGSCNHAYHHHCLGKWILKSKTCPCCNQTWIEQRKDSISH